MSRLLPFLLFGLICSVFGASAGFWLGTEVKSLEPTVMSVVTQIPGADKFAKTDDNSPVEEYQYPKIKWRAKPFGDVKDAIVQLHTTYEPSAQANQPGKMNYRLVVFKVPDKDQFEIQLLDKDGFKLSQFNASDFHQIPGSADLREARDSYACTEDEYKKVRDYSVK